MVGTRVQNVQNVRKQIPFRTGMGFEVTRIPTLVSTGLSVRALTDCGAVLDPKWSRNYPF
jgi:hypothetical protein